MSGSSGGRMRDALSHADFRRVVAAFVVDSVGGWAYSVVLTVYVFDRTGSAGWVTAFLCASWVPKLVVAPYAGVLADRYERTAVMQASALSAFLAMSGLSALVLTDGPLLALLVAAGLTAVCVAPYNPASQALVVDVVPERDLTAANALFLSLENLVLIGGPAIGGLLLLAGEPGAAVQLNALTFLVAALLVTGVRTRSRGDAGAAGESTLTQVADGFRALRGQPVAGRLVLYCLLCTAVCGTTTVLFVALSAERLGTGTEGFSYLIAAFALGGVLSAPLTNRLSAGRLGPAVVVGLLVESLPLAALSVVSSAAVAGVLLVLSGAGMVVVDVLAITALQRAVSRDVLGRVFGVLDAGTYAASILASLVATALIAAFGLEGALVAIGVVASVVAVIGVRPLLRADREAAVELAALAPRIALLEVLDLFTSASRPVVEQLARAVTEVEVAAGEVVVREGEPADALYVLVTGEVAVSARGEGTTQRRLRTMGPRSLFGEIGVLRGIPRTATVRALEPCSLWRITGEDFLAAVESTPVSSSLLSLAGARLARTHPTLAARSEDDAAVPVPV